MASNYAPLATELAARPYSIKVMKDETTDGQMEVYLVRHPELEGCMAQGETIEEALAELDTVRFEYILSLLEDHQDVPAPVTMQTVTGSGEAITYSDTTSSDPDFLDDLEKAVQPATRTEEYEIIPSSPEIKVA